MILLTFSIVRNVLIQFQKQTHGFRLLYIYLNINCINCICAPSLYLHDIYKWLLIMLFIFDYFDFFLNVSQNEWYILYQYWTWYKISVHFLLFVHVSIIIAFRILWAWIARSTCAWFKNVFHPTFFQCAIFFSQIKDLWSNIWVKRLVIIILCYLKYEYITKIYSYYLKLPFSPHPETEQNYDSRSQEN